MTLSLLWDPKPWPRWALLTLVFLAPQWALGQLPVETFFDNQSSWTATQVAQGVGISWTQTPGSLWVGTPGSGTLWVRVQRHQVPPGGGHVLYTPYPALERATAYFVRRGEIVAKGEAGLSQPFENREAPHLFAAFLVPDGVLWDEALLAFSTQAPLKAPLFLTTQKALRSDFQRTMALGLFYGGLMVGAIGLCYLLGQITGLGSQLAYGIKTFATAAMALLFTHIPLPFVAPGMPAHWLLPGIMGFVPLFCLSLLSMFYFITKDYIPVLEKKWIKWTTIILYGAFSLWGFGGVHGPVVAAELSLLLATCLGLCAVTLMSRKQIPPSIFYNFILSQLCVSWGLLQFFIDYFGPFPSHFLVKPVLYFCTLLEVLFLINVLRKKARFINMERIFALQERVSEEKAKEEALALHAQRMKDLVQLGIALRQEAKKESATQKAHGVFQRALGSGLSLNDFLNPHLNPTVKDEDLYFARSIQEMLNSTLAAIDMTTQMVEQEARRNEEALGQAQKQLYIISRVSDRLNSPLMSLHGYLGKLLHVPLGSCPQDCSLFIEMWLKYKNILADSVKSLTDISRELAEARDAYGEVETTFLLTSPKMQD